MKPDNISKLNLIHIQGVQVFIINSLLYCLTVVEMIYLQYLYVP